MSAARIIRTSGAIALLATALEAAAFGPGAYAPVSHNPGSYNPHYANHYGAPVPAAYWQGRHVNVHPATPYRSAPRRVTPAATPARTPDRGAADAPAANGPARATSRQPDPATAMSPAAGPQTHIPDTDISAGEGIVEPVMVERIPDDLAGDLPAAERKRRFLEILTPLVLLENERLTGLRQEVTGLVERMAAGGELDAAAGRRLTELARRYRVDGDPLEEPAARAALLARVDTIPVSLALAQAANESAWGSSRFAREARNLFGIWTYDASKGIVPRRRGAGKKHLVRRFDSLGDSVRYYMHTLNSHPAYAGLRERRAGLRDEGEEPSGMALSEGLEKYSAKGREYVRMIKDMIEDNRLGALENARLAG